MLEDRKSAIAAFTMLHVHLAGFVQQVGILLDRLASGFCCEHLILEDRHPRVALGRNDDRGLYAEIVPEPVCHFAANELHIDVGAERLERRIPVRDL